MLQAASTVLQPVHDFKKTKWLLRNSLVAILSLHEIDSPEI